MSADAICHALSVQQRQLDQFEVIGWQLEQQQLQQQQLCPVRPLRDIFLFYLHYAP